MRDFKEWEQLKYLKKLTILATTFAVLVLVVKANLVPSQIVVNDRSVAVFAVTAFKRIHLRYPCQKTYSINYSYRDRQNRDSLLICLELSPELSDQKALLVGKIPHSKNALEARVLGRIAYDLTVSGDLHYPSGFSATKEFNIALEKVKKASISSKAIARIDPSKFGSPTYQLTKDKLIYTASLFNLMSAEPISDAVFRVTHNAEHTVENVNLRFARGSVTTLYPVDSFNSQQNTTTTFTVPTNVLSQLRRSLIYIHMRHVGESAIQQPPSVKLSISANDENPNLSVETNGGLIVVSLGSLISPNSLVELNLEARIPQSVFVADSYDRWLLSADSKKPVRIDWDPKNHDTTSCGSLKKYEYHPENGLRLESIASTNQKCAVDDLNSVEGASLTTILKNVIGSDKRPEIKYFDQHQRLEISTAVPHLSYPNSITLQRGAHLVKLTKIKYLPDIKPEAYSLRLQ